MGGRRRLAGGYSVWLADHRSPDGLLFRAYLRAGEEIVGLESLSGKRGTITGSARLRVDVRRYAIAGVVFERSSRMWAALVDQRERGKGRRPSERQVERAARRLGLADMSLRDATTRLDALAAARSRVPASPSDLLAAMRDDRDDRRQETSDP